MNLDFITGALNALSSLGTWPMVIVLGIFLLVGVFGWFKYRQYKIDQAHKKTLEDRNASHATTGAETDKIADDAKQAANEIDEIRRQAHARKGNR